MRLTWRDASVAAIPLALVLAVDPGGLAPFGPAKGLALFAFAPLAAGTWLRGRVRVDRSTAVAWGAFLLIGALAAGFGVDRVYAWIGTPERHFGWLTWLLCALLFLTGQQLDDRARRAVAGGAVVAIGLAGAWALVEVIGWHPIALAGAGSRPVGPLGSSAYLGAAAALLGPIAVAWRGRAGAVAVALAAVALVASGARAAWVGAVVAGLAFVVMRRVGAVPNERRGKHRRSGLVGAAAAAAIVAAVALGVAGRATDVVTDRDGGARGRLDEWRVAGRVIVADPVLGTGPEGYRIAFGAHVDTRYEQRHGRDPLPDRAHSALLDVAATTGVAGLLTYAALVALVGHAVVRSLRTGEPLLAGIAAGLVAYAVQSLFLFPTAELDPIAWLLAGVLVAQTGVSVRDVGIRNLAPTLLMALAALGLVAAGLDLAADREARSVLGALDDQRLPGGDGPRRLRPDALRYHLLAARAAAARSTPSGFADALADIDRGLAISPRDPVLAGEQARLRLDRARLTGERRDVGAARATLTRLVRRDPRNAEAWLRLGVATALAGDDAAAERAWLRAERLAPRSAAASADLAVAYARQGRTAEARAAARRALARDPENSQARGILEQTDGTDGGP